MLEKRERHLVSLGICMIAITIMLIVLPKLASFFYEKEPELTSYEDI